MYAYVPDATYCTALLLIPGHLRESFCSMLLPDQEDEQIDSPSHIIMWSGKSLLDGKFGVYAENIIISSSSCLIESFLYMLATYYGFTIAFPKTQQAP